MSDDNVFIKVKGLSKVFTLYHQGGTRIEAFKDLSLEARSRECLALHGPSGAGKSTLLRSLYANYRPSSGSILVRHRGDYIDMVSAAPRTIIDVREKTIGYVSQFLRVIPRVSALDIVAEGLTAIGEPKPRARERAGELLERLRIPRRLWNLAPATFSGGEQQRVNIARGFLRHYPVLLLDEPTASLDAANRATVVELIKEAKQRGAAVVGIFHDDEVREAVAERVFSLKRSTGNA